MTLNVEISSGVVKNRFTMACRAQSNLWHKVNFGVKQELNTLDRFLGCAKRICMTDQELALEIRGWGNRVVNRLGINRRRSPVWHSIKWVAGNWGNWRNAPRGNPKKGYVAMKRGGVD